MTVSGISGNLEDVSVAEVMQFIHLGGRTGTLRLENGEIHAEIGFHRGRIVNSWSPESRRLGDLLVAENLIAQETLDQALTIQAGEHPKRSLGQILVMSENLDLEAIRVAVESQILIRTWMERPIVMMVAQLIRIRPPRVNAAAALQIPIRT